MSALIIDPGNKKLILTEAEKLQRREETARKRKRQSEQKIQDEMVSKHANAIKSDENMSPSLLNRHMDNADCRTQPSTVF